MGRGKRKGGWEEIEKRKGKKKDGEGNGSKIDKEVG